MQRLRSGTSRPLEQQRRVARSGAPFFEFLRAVDRYPARDYGLFDTGDAVGLFWGGDHARAEFRSNPAAHQ